MKGTDGFDLIPNAAKALAALAFVCVTLMILLGFGFASHDFFSLPGAISGVVGFLIGALAAGYVLLAGYVYGDARRRGMPPIPWTALAVMVPNCLGFVLYFLLRKPLLQFCPSCGCGVSVAAAFCSGCGQPQMKTAS